MVPLYLRRDKGQLMHEAGQEELRKGMAAVKEANSQQLTHDADAKSLDEAKAMPSEHIAALEALVLAEVLLNEQQTLVQSAKTAAKSAREAKNQARLKVA